MSGDKHFLWNSIPNILIILGLVYYVSVRKSVGAVLLAVLAYLSVHGGYAIFAAATGDGINTMNELHYERSDLGVKLIGSSFLIYCAILLSLRMKAPLISVSQNIFFSWASFLPLVLFVSTMTYGLIFLSEIAVDVRLVVFKELIFSVSMWIGALVFSVAIKQGLGYFIFYKREWLLATALITTLIAISGVYEITSGMVWAGTYYLTGFSYRASGTLFNPNVLGFWTALMVMLASLVFHLGWISRRLTVGAMALLVSLLILSSSRSGLILSVINLVLVLGTFYWNRNFVRGRPLDWAWPLIAFCLAFISCAFLIECLTPSGYKFLNTMHANLYRFLQLPADVFWIFTMRVFSPIADKLGALGFAPAGLNELVAHLEGAARSYERVKIMESVNGRMVSKYISDNSYVSIYAIGGIVSLTAWLWLWATLLWAALKKNKVAPGALSSYGIVALVFCFASGFFLRAPQLFPVWVFLSMVLGACICWWSSSGSGAIATETDGASKAPIVANTVL